MNEKRLRRNIDFIFDATTRPSGESGAVSLPNRYLAKSLNGGTGWGVFDRKQQRFLNDPEVARLKHSELSETLLS